MLVTDQSDSIAVKGKVSEFYERIETIQEILRRYYGDRGLTVGAIECSEGSKDGDNYMSLIKRIIVKMRTSNKSEYTTSLIIKRQISDIKRRELFRCDVAFENEISAYLGIIPVLKKFSNDNLPYPKLIFAGRDRDGEIIAMEDLSKDGYKMANRIEGLDLEHCSLALKELASLHAISLAMKIIDPLAFYDAVSKTHEVVFSEENCEYFSQVMESTLGDVISSLTNFSNEDGKLNKPIEILKRLGGKRLFSIMMNHVNNSSDNWKVICHGDLWINNLMYHYHNGKVKHVKFVDLQTLRYTNLVCDVLMLLYSSTDGNLRHKHLDRLIEIYQESLISNLRDYLEKNYPKELMTLEQEFSYENIKNEFALRSLYGLGMASWVMPAVTFVSLSSILGSLVDQEESSEAIMMQQQPKEYHSRIQEIVKEFYLRGFLDDIFI